MAEAYGSWATIQNRRRVRAYVNASITSTTNAACTVSINAHCNCDLIAQYGVRCRIGATSNGWSTGATGVCASGSNVASTTRTVTYTRTRSAQTITLNGQVYGETVSGYSAFSGGTSQADVTLTIPAKASHTWSYNANGGSGAPASQTKWYGEHGYLSTTQPTRTGYDFEGWNTKADGTGTSYAPGAECVDDANITFYAQWSELAYTVSFDANGGTGAPAAQTKRYTQSLILSSTAPTRDLYDFLGWATQAGATAAEYQAGGTFTANADTTLYAVWQLAWQAPTIDNVSVYRCDSSGAASDTGTYARVSYTWSTFNDLYPATAVTATCGGTTAKGTAGGTSGTFTQLFGGLDVETAYTVIMSVSDKQGTATRSATVQPMSFIMDFSPTGGVGIDCIAPESGLKVDGDIVLAEGRSFWDMTSGSQFLPWWPTWTNIYPVGSIYLSYVSTSPASLFGGSWTQLTGAFLRAANDTATGGADTHVLTVAEMPRHAHGQNVTANSGGTGVRKDYVADQAKCAAYPQGINTLATGGGGAHNNMPAYQDVYAWRRTA